MKRKTRSRHLTREEIERDRKIRGVLESEKPEISARIRRQMAEIRRAKAASQGGRTLGQRIRAAREARGLSQVSLAAIARISQGYLSQLEQDEREPALSIAVRIAHALGLSVDELAAEVLS
jgi:DNA-binding XRE family transcriptional regulator